MAKRKIGSWELKRKIGSAGNGEVWECIDHAGASFAMKILTRTTGEAYQRFLDEVKVCFHIRVTMVCYL